MKTKVEECKQIPIYPVIRRLQQNYMGLDKYDWQDGFSVTTVLISEHRAKYIKLSYYSNDKEISYKIKLTKEKCHIAGWRYWFLCPLLDEEDKPCGKRVGVLYKPSYEDYFGCRHCHDLTYKSRCYSGYDKKYRPIVSLPSLIEEERSIRRRFYRGRHTKRYKRFLKKQSDTWERLAASTDALYDELYDD